MLFFSSPEENWTDWKGMHNCNVNIRRLKRTYDLPPFFFWYSGGVESNWVQSALRPLRDLLCQHRAIMMMEKLVEWWTIGKGNRSTRRKPAPVPLCPPQTSHAARTVTRAAAVGSQRLTAWATTRPVLPLSFAFEILVLGPELQVLIFWLACRIYTALT
jgi:hypothetical protein